MIKNNKGITLITLAVTIIVMLILAGVGITGSYTGINEVKDNKLNTELGIVRQAITEQYSKAVAVNKTKVSVSEPQVSFWVGEMITDFSNISLPEEDSVVKNEDVNNFFDKLNTYNYEYQEDCYYRLSPEILEKIGIADSDHTYIVNYSTGEVYNETQKVDSNFEMLYLPQTTYDTQNLNTEDKESFNDWE